MRSKSSGICSVVTLFFTIVEYLYNLWIGRRTRSSHFIMPSFVNHSRNYTWPPSMHLLDPSRVSQPTHGPETELPDIDEDPFAHFISPVTEEDDPCESYDFNAGISVHEPPPMEAKTHKFRSGVAKKWARYIAQHHTNLHTLYHGPDPGHNPQIPTIEESVEPPELSEDDEFEPILKDDADDVPYKLEIRAPREPTRGRAQDLLRPDLHRKKGRRYSRTLSGRRHAWREPSPDLFTVMEESEGPLSQETDEGVSRRSIGSEKWERSRL